MVPTLGGGTQDTDFNKGFTKGNFTKNLRRRNGGGQGDPDPLMSNIHDIYMFFSARVGMYSVLVYSCQLFRVEK